MRNAALRKSKPENPTTHDSADERRIGRSIKPMLAGATVSVGSERRDRENGGHGWSVAFLGSFKRFITNNKKDINFSGFLK
jgi:hypothetical protein